MNNLIKDKIKSGEISFQIGDEVVVYTRKLNGYPRSLKDNTSYYVRSMDPDGHLIVAEHSSDGIGFLQPVRVHKMYLIKKSDLREFKLNKLFETK